MLLTIAGVSVVMDLYRMRVSNGWILCSLFAGILQRLLSAGTGGLLDFFLGAAAPIAVVGWLFCFRMLGPGDIKLFCAIGGIMGLADICRCIWFSFLIGAAISLAILISCGNLSVRIRYFLDYLEELLRTGIGKPYYRKGMQPENIHFTVPIFMSVMLYAGGVY